MRGISGWSAKSFLAQEKIFIAVAVHVAHGDAKGGRELRLPRQRAHFKMIAAVKKKGEASVLITSSFAARAWGPRMSSTPAMP